MNEIVVNARTLRHGLTCLWPSEIADQWYCEYKVHLKRVHHEVRLDLPSLELGEANHAALVSQAEPIGPAEIDQAIQTGKKVAICERVLEGIIHGVRIRGRPDLLTFEGKNALLLLDFKFSPAEGPFPDHEVQTEVYALLAESMGFATDGLWLGIVLFPQARQAGGRQDASLQRAALLRSYNGTGTLREIHERCEQTLKEKSPGPMNRATIKSEGWKAFLFRHDPAKAKEYLTWALGYWLGEREPTWEKRFPKKCVACPFNAVGLCPHALQKSDQRFRVQRSADGRILVSR